MTTGRLFLDNLSYFELYALYAKNKPKSDQLMREAGHKFFSSVQVGRMILFVFGLVNVSSVFESVSDFLIGFRRYAIFLFLEVFVFKCLFLFLFQSFIFCRAWPTYHIY